MSELRDRVEEACYAQFKRFEFPDKVWKRLKEYKRFEDLVKKKQWSTLAAVGEGLAFAMEEKARRGVKHLSQLKARTFIIAIDNYRRDGVRNWREIHRLLRDGGFPVPRSPDSLRRQYLRWRRSCPLAVKQSQMLARFTEERSRRRPILESPHEPDGVCWPS